jgi:hypothetical protein
VLFASQRNCCYRRAHGRTEVHMSEPDQPDYSSLLDFSDLIPTTEASNTPAQQISLCITRAQKEKLLEMGFEEGEIREMKPEDAHKFLVSEDLKPK